MRYSAGLITLDRAGVDGAHVTSQQDMGFPAEYTQFTLCGAFYNCGVGPIRFEGPLIGPAQLSFFISNGEVDANFAFVTSGLSATVRLKGPPGQNAQWLFPAVSPPQTIYIQFSIDTVAQTVNLYVNDVAATPTNLVWGASGTLGSSYAVTRQFQVTSAASGTGSGFGDLWVDQRYVDFSVTANRRKFINADLSLVDPGANGQTPFGADPIVFLHAPAGGPLSAFANVGSGGDWTTTGPLVAGDPTCGIIPPPDPPPTPPDPLPDGIFPDPPMVFLSWSDDRGHSFGNPVGISLGAIGEYVTSLQWQRLGMGRSRVFQLEWSSPVRTALMGAWLDRTPALT